QPACGYLSTVAANQVQIGTLTQSYEAAARSIPAARQAIVQFAARAGAGGELLDSVRMAASEALTNVVQHAYDERPGRTHVTAALAGGELCLLVADHGHGLCPRTENRGLGLG